jgi:hypothetical protein
MKTLSLKLPEILESQLDIFARKNGISRSEIVRRALLEYFSRDEVSRPGSFLELARDLAGSIEGPSDLSTNKDYLEGYGK